MTVVKEIFDCEILIREVEKRPPLYDTSLKEYTDRVYKAQLWDEISQIVVSNWRQLTAADKVIKGKDVLKRWKAIRDCFRREATFQKKGETMMKNGQKRKPYIYYNLLTFLQPGLEKIDQSQYYLAPSTDEYEEDSVDPLNLDPPPSRTPTSPLPPVLTPSVPPPDHLENNHDTPIPNQRPPQPAPRVPKRSNPAVPFENALLDLLQESNKKSQEMDDDKAFLMSILPSLRKFKDDEKFTVRMEIMKTIDRMRNNVPTQSSQSQQQPCLPIIYTINVPAAISNIQQSIPTNQLAGNTDKTNGTQNSDKTQNDTTENGDKTQNGDKTPNGDETPNGVKTPNGKKTQNSDKTENTDKSANKVQDIDLTDESSGIKRTGIKRRHSSSSEGSLVIDDDCDVIEL